MLSSPLTMKVMSLESDRIETLLLLLRSETISIFGPPSI